MKTKKSNGARKSMRYIPAIRHVMHNISFLIVLLYYLLYERESARKDCARWAHMN
jgi:hypothetical protein